MKNLSKHRFASLFVPLLLFLIVNFFVRCGLMFFAPQDFWHLTTLKAFLLGTLYDLAVACYVLIPFVLLATFCSNSLRGQKIYTISFAGLLLILILLSLFIGLSEFFFWNEFSARFNFIAVDYLIYTKEVVGNIWQSYPVIPFLVGLGVVTALLWRWSHLKSHPLTKHPAYGWRRRLPMGLVLLCLPLVSYALVSRDWKDALPNTAKEWAGNGYYEFCYAFHANSLSYAKYYPLLPNKKAWEIVRTTLQNEAGPNERVAASEQSFMRHIKGAGLPHHCNVILVSMESMGSDFMSMFGNRAHLTPHLDQLAKEGLVFNNFYATGLRTTRGLEAITLSLPPLPGHAIPMRKKNKGLQSLGSTLKHQGYQVAYLYGGYSYFDNMQDFFSGNQYQVHDRRDIDPQTNIVNETIWGVPDEYLFDLSIAEIDDMAENHKPWFIHIMTTSNHRPYIYPSGRINIPSGKGREGAVKYADYAIGRFVDQVRNKPWFKDTLFVFVADHTSHGRGRTDLPPEHYHIPMIFYMPSQIKHQEFNILSSQIDIAPTIMGILNLPYQSQFLGQDLLKTKHPSQRAFMANYLTVGMMENHYVVELLPKRHYRIIDTQTNQVITHTQTSALQALLNKTIAFYQVSEQLVDKYAQSTVVP